MTMQYILNSDGEPVPENSPFIWGNWMETAERHAASTTINGVYVSTVFLGLDHSFFDGPPVLWETMEFDGKQDQNQWRYTSKEAAVKNHHRVCERIRKRFNKKHLHPLDQAARSTWLLGGNS